MVQHPSRSSGSESTSDRNQLRTDCLAFKDHLAFILITSGSRRMTRDPSRVSFIYLRMWLKGGFEQDKYEEYLVNAL